MLGVNNGLPQQFNIISYFEVYQLTGFVFFITVNGELMASSLQDSKKQSLAINAPYVFIRRMSDGVRSTSYCKDCHL